MARATNLILLYTGTELAEASIGSKCPRIGKLRAKFFVSIKIFDVSGIGDPVDS